MSFLSQLRSALASNDQEAIRCNLIDFLSNSTNDISQQEALEWVSVVREKLEKDADLLNYISFDVLPLMLQWYSQAAAAADVSTEQLAALLLFCARSASSAKEIYSISMEAIASTQNFALINMCIRLLQEALPRLPSTSRHKFLANALPTVLTRAQAVLTIPKQQDPELMKLEFQKRLQNDVLFVRFVPALLSLGECIAKAATTDKEKSWILSFCTHLLARMYSNQELVRQLSAAASQANGLDALERTVAIIVSCRPPSMVYLLQYDIRFRLWLEYKRRSEQEEAEESDDYDDDEEAAAAKPKAEDDFVQWNPLGLGVLAYLHFVCNVAKDAFETSGAVLSNVYLFDLCKAYMEQLLVCPLPQLALTGKTLADHFLTQKLPAYSLALASSQQQPQVRHAQLESYFSFMQALVNFMAMCPDDRLRTEAYHLLQAYISKFYDEGRFELLRGAICTCPFPVLLGLLMHRFKEEIRLEYDALLVRTNRKVNESQPYRPVQPPSHHHHHDHHGEECKDCSHGHHEHHQHEEEEDEQAHNHAVSTEMPPIVRMDQETIKQLRIFAKKESSFLSKDSLQLLISDVLPKHVQEGPSIENADVLLHGLNALYFLLLRDAEPNITGIMDGDIQEELQSKILEPLSNKFAAQPAAASAAAAAASEMSDDDDSDDAESFDSDQFDADFEEKMKNMTEEELEAFLAEQEVSDEDSDEEEAAPHSHHHHAAHSHAHSHQHAAHGAAAAPHAAMSEKQRLELRFSMIQDVLGRISHCVTWNKQKVQKNSTVFQQR